MFQKFYSSTKEHVSSVTDGAMAPAAMMNDLAYSLLLAQSDNIHMYYFTRINTHRPLGKKWEPRNFPNSAKKMPHLNSKKIFLGQKEHVYHLFSKIIIPVKQNNFVR